MSPKLNCFYVTKVFGQKATDQMVNPDISEEIKVDLLNSKVYMEGRFIRIELNNLFS